MSHYTSIGGEQRVSTRWDITKGSYFAILVDVQTRRAGTLPLLGSAHRPTAVCALTSAKPAIKVEVLMEDLSLVRLSMIWWSSSSSLDKSSRLVDIGRPSLVHTDDYILHFICASLY